MEYFVIVLFSLILLLTMLFKIHLLYALGCGYMLFFLYGLYKGCTVKDLFEHSFDGIKNIGNLVSLFILIGILTATWRACGSIAYLVVNSTYILIPSLFLFSTFVLCTIISMLTGTSFGTSATMGVICMTMGNILNIDPAYLGGAILSGSYFGDRMSPLSTSAHLVAKITRTYIFINIRNMFRSCIIPTILTCLIYILLGYENSGQDIPRDTLNLLEKSFTLSWEASIPVLFVLILALLRVNSKIIMLVSIVAASLLTIFIQKISLMELLKLYWFGFSSQDVQLNAVLGGGGVISMLTVVCIISISSSYVGIFKISNFFEIIYTHIAKLSEKITPFGSTAVTSLFVSMITCNQTLSIFLIRSLFEKQYKKNRNLAHAIENSAVVLAGLVPWNIACSVVLTNVDAPASSVLYAFLLYLIPIISFFQFRKQKL